MVLPRQPRAPDLRPVVSHRRPGEALSRYGGAVLQVRRRPVGSARGTRERDGQVCRGGARVRPAGVGARAAPRDGATRGRPSGLRRLAAPGEDVLGGTRPLPDRAGAEARARIRSAARQRSSRRGAPLG